ncbi:hypothetical protein CK934_21655 [Chitinophaga sp. MD30]|nr:hypothetical protein CK934_21655 [Chitinophaga sp. MD30]
MEAAVLPVSVEQMDSVEMADALYTISHPRYASVRASGVNMVLLMVSNSRQEAGTMGAEHSSPGKAGFGLPRVFYLPAIETRKIWLLTVTDLLSVCPIARLLIFPEHIFW